MKTLITTIALIGLLNSPQVLSQRGFVDRFMKPFIPLSDTYSQQTTLGTSLKGLVMIHSADTY